METSENKARKSTLGDRLREVAYNPVQLRAVLTFTLLAGWYVGFAMPAASEIDETTRQITRQRGRLALAKDVERLRAEVARFQERVPKTTDPNEWVQYMLTGFRRFPELRVVTLDPDKVREVGPYKAVILRTQVEGSFRQVDAFLRWLETNRRLLRVDSVQIAPAQAERGHTGTVSATLVVLGVTG